LSQETSSSITQSMDNKFFRQVPNRFISQDQADACKVEKLTNLFPEMKSTIELEIFKINNLSSTIERLSRIYPVSTAIDIRDDTLHVLVGPYSIRLAPALFAAFHLKQVSQTIMQTTPKRRELTTTAAATETTTTTAAATEATTTNSTVSVGGKLRSQRRQREVALRRFRRAVRKIGLVKQIIDRLQTPSILTPINQYELHNHGIYELVLRRQSSSTDDSQKLFEQMKDYKEPDEQNPFLASNFIKITSLLNLLGSSTTQQPQPQPQLQQPQLQQPQEEKAEKINFIKSNTTVPLVIEKDLNENERSTPYEINSNELTENLLDLSSNDSTNHSSVINHLLAPVSSSSTPPLSTITTTLSTSRESFGASKAQAILSEQSRTNSTDNSYNDTPLSTSFNNNTTTLLTSIEPITRFEQPLDQHSSLIPTDEDSLINNISNILTNHLMFKKNYDTINDSSITDSGISLNTNSGREKTTYDFGRIIQRIKMTVEQKLFENDVDQQLKSTNDNSPSSIPLVNDNSHSISKHNGIVNRRQQLLALHAVSCHETHSDDYYDIIENNVDKNNNNTNTENKEKLLIKHQNWSLKSHSFDMTNSSDSELNDATSCDAEKIHMTSQFISKGVQTDPRIKNSSRSRFLDKIRLYIDSCIRHREELFNQYNISNSYYEQHYTNMHEIQRVEYRDLLNVRNEILNRFDWVIIEMENISDNLRLHQITISDAELFIHRPLVQEVIESSLIANENKSSQNLAVITAPNEQEWQMYNRDLRETKDDLEYIGTLVQRGISKVYNIYQCCYRIQMHINTTHNPIYLNSDNDNDTVQTKAPIVNNPNNSLTLITPVEYTDVYSVRSYSKSIRSYMVDIQQVDEEHKQVLENLCPDM
ncbi:unnamed protein product, partial [Didymodactylos carnosus]